jgi:hypothetical protein
MAMRRGETPSASDQAVQELFALSELDPLLRNVLDRHGVDRHRFSEIFERLMGTGAGQWAGKHYVAASALAFAPTLDFVFTNVDRLPWPTINVLLLEYFERGEVGPVSLELRGSADNNDPQQDIDARTLSETPETGTINTKLESLQQRAEQGDAEAQSNLGDAYRRGQGVPQDYAQAVAWFRQAAEQGHANAQSNLGVAYRTGQGVPQDDAQAVTWYRQAAEQGFAQAQFNLGFMYDTGQGVPQDDAQAVSWYREAADQGDASAQFNLGYAYENGQGVTQDFVEGYKWQNLAASSASAKNEPKFAEFRDDLATQMTPAQLTDAQKLASEWQAAFDARQE